MCIDCETFDPVLEKNKQKNRKIKYLGALLPTFMVISMQYIFLSLFWVCYHVID